MTRIPPALPVRPTLTADSTRPPEHHAAASALSPTDIGYVDSLMGIAPAQAMASIMLKTGVPMPANLGQDFDTTA